MSTKNQSPKVGETRRKFLKKTGATAAAAGLLQFPATGANRAPSINVKGANDRIVVGFIGVGGRGFGAHVRQMRQHAKANNIAQAAVCDASTHRIGVAKSFIEKNSDDKVTGYKDYRKLLERKDIDAVVVATVDHWHTPVSIQAMESGKEIYVEKPMSRYLDEAFELYDAAKRLKKTVQVGSQITSCGNFAKAAKLVAEGKLGPLVLAQGSYMRNNPKGEWNYRIQDWATEKDIDWNGKTGWMGQVKKRVPFNADHYFRWRKYLPYCAGLLGDLIPHRLFPLMRATGKPEFPSRVVCLGTRKVTPDREVSDNTQVLAEFPSGMTLLITSSTINEQGFGEIIRGHYGTMYLSSNGSILEYKPERPFAEEFDPESYTKLEPSGNTTPQHHTNWFNGIRTGEEPNAGIDLAIKVQTVISLAELSDRRGTMCHFDPKTRKVTDGSGRVIKQIDYAEEAKLESPYGPSREVGS
jgi:predicted dehydrogenase